ncbi:hypothetical protein E1B28_001367 [Marasmius oreades]|uniref:C2H2-type domain-containing protein n=1 Tax=Marasmius oreades TaxID=181124 RepID=A0A9P7V3C4_9AGAR|nr:uncharacterized protein E1B28_001367 [Marasmius oreades]KAG7099526.1 hypothetical protein E1B28_001367 [Marasmius oreades]
MAELQTAALLDDIYTNVDYGKQFFDAFPSEVHAPPPDLFESELDSSLAGIDPFQFELLEVNHTDAFSRLRSDTPTCGPPSLITVSSESASAYDSFSSYSESIYNYSKSSFDIQSNCSFPLDMDFQRLEVASDYGVQQLLDGVDPTSFGSMPPTPPRSPPNHGANNGKVYSQRTSYSDYGPSRGVVPNDYYNVTYGSTLTPATVSPTHVSQLPPSVSLPQNEELKGDPRKKYKCSSCPRGFARAYNLKTHMATHDPNREKPFVCPHRTCSRSFSRKHDLGRHLISIHRDESVCSSRHSTSSKKSIGVEKGTRTWCESCGKSWIGRVGSCNCNNAK